MCPTCPVPEDLQMKARRRDEDDERREEQQQQRGGDQCPKVEQMKVE
jgi:hypothetical protein